MAEVDNIESKRVNIFTRLFLWLVMMIIIASLGIVVSWLNKPGNFPFKKVELVNQLENQESSELQRIAAEALNGGFFSLDVDAFRAELVKQLPWVKSVSVRKLWPDKLAIEIIEYKPVVRWQSVDSHSSMQAKQLLSREGVIFKPHLTAAQIVKFEQMVLFFGPKMNAGKILEKCYVISKKLTSLGLGIQHCGMNNRRTWKLNLTGFKKNRAITIEIKLGKNNVIQSLERFVQVFSGKLEPYLDSIESVDLRYSNGFSVKWNTSGHSQKEVINKPLIQ